MTRDNGTETALISINNWPDMLTLPSLAVGMSAAGAVWIVPDRAVVALMFCAIGGMLFLASAMASIGRALITLESILFDLPQSGQSQRKRTLMALLEVREAYPDEMRLIEVALVDSFSTWEYLRGVHAATLVERARPRLDGIDLDHLGECVRRARADAND